tara:strand:+ start:1537 stop:1686 length:150 start_codon:yes stop_codon:yes gene_type:complete
MSTWDIMTLLAYACALIGALFSKPDTGKVKWMLWAILILLGYIAGEVGP